MGEFTSKGMGGTALGLGIGGTALGLLNGGLGGLFGGGNQNFARKEDVENAKVLAEKDATIALLTSEKNTNDTMNTRLVEVYEAAANRDKAIRAEIYEEFKEVRKEMQENKDAQSAINTAQAVTNSTVTSGLAVMSANLTCLQNTINGLTKTIIPATNVCPQPMAMYNSWTAPTTSTTTA